MTNSSDNLTLVLLPGLDGTGELFSPFIEQFPAEQRILKITYPTDYFIPLEALQHYIISKLPEDQPLVLLGESYSGPVAAMIASSHKVDIRGVIFVATFVRFPQSILKILSQRVPLVWLLRLPIPNILIRFFCFGRWYTSSLSKMLRKSIRANQAEILAQRIRSATNLDVRQSLDKIEMPCLYIQASNDRLVPDKAVIDFKQRIRNLEVHKMNGAHFILQTQPKISFEVIISFMRQFKLSKNIK